MPSYHYRDPHDKDKTVSRPCYHILYRVEALVLLIRDTLTPVGEASARAAQLPHVADGHSDMDIAKGIYVTHH